MSSDPNRTHTAAPAHLPKIPSSEDLARALEEARALPEGAVLVPNVDVYRAASVVLASWARLAPLLPDLAALPHSDGRAIESVFLYAHALREAEIDCARSRVPSHEVWGLHLDAVAVRRSFLLWADALADAGLIAPARVAAVPRGQTRADVARGLEALVLLFRGAWERIALHTALRREALDHAEDLALRLTVILGRDTLPADRSTADSRLRDRVFTLLARAWSEIRHGLAYQLRDPDAVAALAPALSAGAHKRPKHRGGAEVNTGAPAGELQSEGTSQPAGHPSRERHRRFDRTARPHDPNAKRLALYGPAALGADLPPNASVPPTSVNPHGARNPEPHHPDNPASPPDTAHPTEDRAHVPSSIEDTSNPQSKTDESERTTPMNTQNSNPNPSISNNPNNVNNPNNANNAQEITNMETPVTTTASCTTHDIAKPFATAHALELVRDEALRLAPEVLLPVRGDALQAAARALAALHGLEPFLDEICSLPRTDSAAVKSIARYAHAMVQADADWIATGPDQSETRPIAERALTLRADLLAEGQSQARHGRFRPDALAGVAGGTGYMDLSRDLTVLSTEFRSRRDELAGHCGIDEEEVAEAADVALRLAVAASAQGQSASVAARAQATELRRRVYTLLARAWDEVRRAMSYLRGREGDADEWAPSLYVAPERRSKEDPGSDTPTTGGTEEPKDPPAVTPKPTPIPPPPELDEGPFVKGA